MPASQAALAGEEVRQVPPASARREADSSQLLPQLHLRAQEHIPIPLRGLAGRLRTVAGALQRSHLRAERLNLPPGEREGL